MRPRPGGRKESIPNAKSTSAALGTTATADYFRPLQPVLAAVSVVMLGLALRARFRARGRGATARSRESAAPVPGAAVADRQG